MLMDNVGIYEDPSMEVLKSRSAYFGYPDGLFQIKQEQSGEEFQANYNLMAHMTPGFPPFAFPQPIMHPATPSYRILGNPPVTAEQEQYAQGFFELAAKSMQQKMMTGNEMGYSNAFGVPQSVPSTVYPQTPSVGLVAQTYANMTNPDLSLKNPQLQIIEAQSNTSSPYSSREDLRSVASASHLGNGSPAGSDVDMYATNVMHEAMAEVPDMMNQERIKSERKKARNRIAAKKCRNSRLQREAELEGTVREMSQKNAYLQDQKSQLVEQINNMKAQLIEHMRNGCPVEVPSDIDITQTSSPNPHYSNTSSPLTVQA